MTGNNVRMMVPPRADHLALLRSTIFNLAGRQHFTVDQMRDLELAVGEAGAQLLLRATSEPLTMDAALNGDTLQVRLSTPVEGTEPILDDSSLAWMLLSSLADDLASEVEDGHASIVLSIHRPPSEPAGASA